MHADLSDSVGEARSAASQQATKLHHEIVYDIEPRVSDDSSASPTGATHPGGMDVPVLATTVSTRAFTTAGCGGGGRGFEGLGATEVPSHLPKKVASLQTSIRNVPACEDAAT